MHYLARFLIDRWDRRQRAKRHTAIATQGYSTGITGTDDLASMHVVTFWVDGNGNRFSTVETTDVFDAGAHRTMLYQRTMWRVHGELPENCERVVTKGARGNVVLLHPPKDAA